MPNAERDPIREFLDRVGARLKQRLRATETPRPLSILEHARQFTESYSPLTGTLLRLAGLLALWLILLFVPAYVVWRLGDLFSWFKVVAVGWFLLASLGSLLGAMSFVFGPPNDSQLSKLITALESASREDDARHDPGESQAQNADIATNVKDD